MSEPTKLTLNECDDELGSSAAYWITLIAMSLEANNIRCAKDVIDRYYAFKDRRNP